MAQFCRLQMTAVSMTKHSYYLYFIVYWQCRIFCYNRLYLFMTHDMDISDCFCLVCFVFLVCQICVISLASGSGMSGTRSPGRETRAPGRGAARPGRTRRGSCRGETRSVGAFGGEKWEAGRRGSQTVDIVGTWSPGIIGIRTTPDRISWELKVNSFNIGEEFCIVDHSSDHNFQVKYNAWRWKTKPGEKINCQENRVRLKAARRKILNKEEWKYTH